MWTSIFGSATGSFFSSTEFTSVKIAAFAPIPSASVSSTVIMNPGVFRNCRSAYCTSCMSVVIISFSSKVAVHRKASPTLNRKQLTSQNQSQLFRQLSMTWRKSQCRDCPLAILGVQNRTPQSFRRNHPSRSFRVSALPHHKPVHRKFPDAQPLDAPIPDSEPPNRQRSDCERPDCERAHRTRANRQRTSRCGTPRHCPRPVSGQIPFLLSMHRNLRIRRLLLYPCRLRAVIGQAPNASTYTSNMPRSLTRSRHLQQRAEKYLPGGVDSPVRAFRAVGGDPPFLTRAEGAWLYDEDDNRYLDLFGSWGPMILGHAFPPVVEAIQQAVAKGASFGASIAAEANLAEFVTHCFPSIEKLRFVSSGTEACMSAIRLARGFTGRNFVIKFEGCYHGHSDAMLVKAGSGVATLGIPGSAGVPAETAMHTIALPYNSLDAVREAFAARRDEIACVIVEPVVGNAGTIAPAAEYLQGLRQITAQHGALLILDEVMTGFRLSLGGAQQVYGITPDLTTLGKIIGGGLPCGAFGGRADVMEFLAPLGPVYQAGTLSGNPLAMAAGIATLEHLIRHEEEVYLGLESTTSRIAEGVAGVAREAGISVTTNRVGSMFTWFLTGEPVTDFATAVASDTAVFGWFHRAMMDAGVWLPPSQFEAAFVSTAHGEAEIGMVLEAARTAFASK